MAELIHLDLGRAAYGPTLALQRRLIDEVRAAGPERAYLLTVEHDPPVITLGRSGKPEHLRAGRDELAASGIEVHEVDRGGDVTCHGPGQLVGYPILRLDLHGRDVRRYLRDLEEVVIGVLATFGVKGERLAGLTGVWVGGEKVCAIGVAVRKWVTWHGLAINVASDLSLFERIVPCGLHDKPVTSLSRLLGREIAVNEVKKPLAESLAEVFDLRLTHDEFMGHA